jgi:hypothetical protein
MDSDELSKRILTADDFLLSKGSENDDSRIRIFDSFYNQLKKHDIETEKIAIIPSDSKKIERDGRILWISPKAINKMEQLDNLTRTSKTDIEFAGFGLTKSYDDKTTVVVDFLAPRADKIFVLELPVDAGFDYPGNFQRLREIGKNLMELLALSSQLKLIYTNNEICLESDNRDSPVSLERMITDLDGEQKNQAWDLIYEFLNRLSYERLPGDISILKNILQSSGSVQLNTDWDVVVSPNYSLETVHYVTRLIVEAKQQNAMPDYSMHYHPSVAGILLDSMKKGIRPSRGDFEYAKRRKIRWYEIRILGTDEEPESKINITSQVYNTYEIYSIEPFIRNIIEEIEVLDPNVGPEELSLYVETLSSYLEKLSNLNYTTADVVKFVLGKRKHDKIFHESDVRNVSSIKGMVLRAITYPVNPESKLQKISLDILKMHVKLNTHSIYQQIMKAVTADPNGGKKLNNLGHDDKPLLCNLSIATDADEIKKGLQIAVEFLDTLEAPSVKRDKVLLNQIKAVRQFL